MAISKKQLLERQYPDGILSTQYCAASGYDPFIKHRVAVRGLCGYFFSYVTGSPANIEDRIHLYAEPRQDIYHCTDIFHPSWCDWESPLKTTVGLPCIECVAGAGEALHEFLTASPESRQVTDVSYEYS